MGSNKTEVLLLRTVRVYALGMPSTGTKFSMYSTGVPYLQQIRTTRSKFSDFRLYYGRKLTGSLLPVPVQVLNLVHVNLAQLYYIQ